MKVHAIFLSVLLGVSVGAAVPAARPTFFQQEVARSLGISAHVLKCSAAMRAHLSSALRDDGLVLASISWRGDAVVFRRDGEAKDFVALFDGERLIRIVELASIEKQLWFEGGPPSYLAR